MVVKDGESGVLTTSDDDVVRLRSHGSHTRGSSLGREWDAYRTLEGPSYIGREKELRGVR